MKKVHLFIVFILISYTSLIAQKKEKNAEKEIEELGLDSAQLSLITKLSQLEFKNEGEVSIANGKATIKIPKGFKYLDGKQSDIVLHDYWGNPPQESDGMLFSSDANLLDPSTWAFVVNYSDEGHIDDSDAQSLNYDDLLKQMKEDTKEGSVERKKLGYPSIELIGWASQPYYDASQKTLHWAKELSFDGETIHTLNYDVRILGRSGLISMNAVGTMDVVDSVKQKIPAILAAVTFTDGNKYSDFNPSIDKVAAVGIGGLVAGKVLAKAGIFALLLKYLKVLLIPFIALGGWLKRKFTGEGNEESQE